MDTAQDASRIIPRGDWLRLPLFDRHLRVWHDTLDNRPVWGTTNVALVYPTAIAPDFHRLTGETRVDDLGFHFVTPCLRTAISLSHARELWLAAARVFRANLGEIVPDQDYASTARILTQAATCSARGHFARNYAKELLMRTINCELQHHGGVTLFSPERGSTSFFELRSPTVSQARN